MYYSASAAIADVAIAITPTIAVANFIGLIYCFIYYKNIVKSLYIPQMDIFITVNF